MKHGIVLVVGVFIEISALGKSIFIEGCESQIVEWVEYCEQGASISWNCKNEYRPVETGKAKLFFTYDPEARSGSGVLFTKLKGDPVFLEQQFECEKTASPILKNEDKCSAKGVGTRDSLGTVGYGRIEFSIFDLRNGVPRSYGAASFDLEHCLSEAAE